MTSVGPDWHDKTAPILWRTHTCCKYPSHPPADGSARHCFGFNFTCLRVDPLATVHRSAPDVRCCFHWNVANVGIIQGNGTTLHHRHSEGRCCHTQSTAQHIILIHENGTCRIVRLLSIIVNTVSNKSAGSLHSLKLLDLFICNTARVWPSLLLC
jgi:hypothetical protein